MGLYLFRVKRTADISKGLNYVLKYYPNNEDLRQHIVSLTGSALMNALRNSNLEKSTVLRTQAAIGQIHFVYLTQREESDSYLAQYMGEKPDARVGNYGIVD